MCKSYEATQKDMCREKQLLSHTYREEFRLYRLEIAEDKFAQYHNDMTWKRGISPFLLCNLLTFYAIC